MGIYFECNIPTEPPSYLHSTAIQDYLEISKAVRSRMEKLNSAQALSELDGATFSEYAKVLFDTRFDRFEAMTDKELAIYALTVHDGSYVAQPRLEWPNAIVVIDTAFVTVKEWEMLRCIGIGGSDAAIVSNCSHYRSPYDLYHDKRHTPIKLEEASKEAIFERGHAMEGKVIETFCSLSGAKLIPETRMFMSKDYPHSTANPDAIVQFMNGDIFVFEAKTTISENYLAWEGGRVPLNYIPQTRQYPGVLNDDRIKGTYIGCLFTYDYIVGDMYVGSDTNVGKFLARVIERDRDTEISQMEANEKFFEEYIEAGIEPPFVGNPGKDIASLRRIQGPADKALDVVPLDMSTFRDVAEEYLKLAEKKKMFSDQEKAVEDRMRQLSIPLIDALGQAVEGRIQINETQYYEVKHSPRAQTKVDYARLEAVYPDAYADCVFVNPEGSRVFSLKEKEIKKTTKARKKPAV